MSKLLYNLRKSPILSGIVIDFAIPVTGDDLNIHCYLLFSTSSIEANLLRQIRSKKLTVNKSISILIGLLTGKYQLRDGSMQIVRSISFFESSVNFFSKIRTQYLELNIPPGSKCEDLRVKILNHVKKYLDLYQDSTTSFDTDQRIIETCELILIGRLKVLI